MFDSYRDKTYLVTGGAGFIGSHLVEELVQRQARVVVVDNLSTGDLRNLAAVRNKIELVQLDILKDDLRPLLRSHEFNSIFHLVSNTDVQLSVSEPVQDLTLNATGTLNVLEAVKDVAPHTPFIYTSSAAVYGNGSTKPIREDAPTFPIAPYGVSKLAGDHYTSAFAFLHEMRTACLRLFPVYGPRIRRQVVYDFIQKLMKNPRELFIYGDGTQVRDLNHVVNIAEAHLIVAERGRLAGEVYNVASEEPVSIQELAEIICDEMKLSPRFDFSGTVRPGDAQHWIADISRIKALGYKPRLKLREGLASVIDWCKADRQQNH